MRPGYLPFSEFTDKIRWCIFLIQFHCISYQLRKVQNAGMVIKGNVETGYIHLIGIRKDLIKQDIIISMPQRLKDSAALPGHLQPNPHVLPAVEMDGDMVIVKATMVAMYSLVKQFPGTFLKSQHFHEVLGTMYLTCNGNPVKQNTIFQLFRPPLYIVPPC